MSEYKISWRPEALQDVSEHILFLLNVNTQAAIDLKKQLFDGVNSLKEFPERSPILEMPNNSPLEIRKKVINKRYLVLYAIQNKEVEIYRVLDSRKKFEYLIQIKAHVKMMGLIGMGNNPMVGEIVAVAVSVAQALAK